MLLSAAWGHPELICPTCHSGSCRRSQRRGAKDRFWGLFGLRPWRCRTCDIRFLAWVVPVRHVRFVHCPRCGNFDLQRVSRDRVVGDVFAPLQRALHFPAYRCDPCRLRFFSLRFFRPIPVLGDESSPSETSDS